MRGPRFEDVCALLAAVQLSAADLSRLRDWIAGIAHPDACIALAEAAAAGRPCPHCGCTGKHRCGQASGLQRFRCLGCRRGHNALTGTRLARLRKEECRLVYLQCVLDSRTVNVSSRHSRFKSWLVRFRGIASRYPTHYAGWQRMLDARRLTSPAHLLCAAVRAL